MCSLQLYYYTFFSNIRLDEIATWVNTNWAEEHGLLLKMGNDHASIQSLQKEAYTTEDLFCGTRFPQRLENCLV